MLFQGYWGSQTCTHTHTHTHTDTHIPHQRCHKTQNSFRSHAHPLFVQYNYWRLDGSFRFFPCPAVMGDAGRPCLADQVVGTCSEGFRGLHLSCVCPSTCLSVSLSLCLSVSLSLSLPLCLSACLPASLSICLPLCPSSACLPCLPACLSVCLSVFCLAARLNPKTLPLPHPSRPPKFFDTVFLHFEIFGEIAGTVGVEELFPGIRYGVKLFIHPLCIV